MSLISLPSISLILSPIGGGKTSLIKFLLLQHIQNIVCCLIFSNTRIDAYEKNYKFLNPKFIRDTWDDNIIPKVLKLAKRIKKHNPEKHIILIFNDSIGIWLNHYSKINKQKG